jgi:hypothetical protein
MHIRWSLAAFAVAMLFVPAKGDAIYSNFGASYSYDGGSGWNVDSLGGNYPIAFLFTAQVSGTVGQIDIALSRSEFHGGGATASLWTNNANRPGVQLGSWHVTATNPLNMCCDVITIGGLSGPSLNVGDAYFLVMTADPNILNYWNWNNQGVTGLHLFSADGGANWTPVVSPPAMGAFAILSTSAVPEPATLTMLVIGGAVMFLLRRNGVGTKRPSKLARYH